jgi:CRP-like cAMP-binding protein
VSAPDARLLAAVSLFKGLNEAALQEVAAAARSRTVAGGALFFAEGDDATAFYVVQAGSVKLTQLSPEGHTVVLRLLGDGDAFGGVAAFSGGTYPITAEAVTETTAFEGPGASMARLIEQHPALAMNALRFVQARLQDLQVQYRQLSTDKVERRVARAFLRLVQHAGKRVEGGVLIDLPLSREDIAQMTGTTLFTVSRIVSRWEAAGLIEAGRQRMVIRNPHGLLKIADDL